jgi:hypothetical protein
MQQVFEPIHFVVGDAEILVRMPKLASKPLFDQAVVGFLSALSSALLKSTDANSFPDAVTFAFWCRRSNIMSLSKLYEESNRLGRGVVLHIAPSNVPLNFAYSMVVGMLAGNANIVRLPSKDFPQTTIVCREIAELLLKPEFSQIAEKLCLIRYPHNIEITDALSKICQSRVIWGGDSTVAEIRRSPLPARANEITFPDRYSLCVIDSDIYLKDYDKTKTARDFYNDTYLTDQNACTSPRIVIWLGSQREQAKQVFWNELQSLLRDYDLQPVQTVNKLTTFLRYAADSKCMLSRENDYKLLRIDVTCLDRKLLDNLENSGYFYEYDADSLDEILPLCHNKCQTLSYIGLCATSIRDFILKNAPAGIDRIVPTGRTMDFSLIWDGQDLIRGLSRVVVAD